MRRLHTASGLMVFSAALAIAVTGGCDDAPAPLPQGGWSLTFTSAGGTCNINSHNASVGEVSQSTATKLVQQGQNSADVTCAVTPVTGGFSVEGNASSGGASLSITIPAISSAAVFGSGVPGSLAFISTKTQNVFASPTSTPCNFYFSDPAEGVSAGAIWVAFDCPKVVYNSHECGISTGFAKFVNCDGAVLD
ncbi:MAG: hypothetical protein U0414_26860 [Polyangiaceae bacterium]